MSKLSGVNNLIIIKKRDIETLLENLRQEREQAKKQQPQLDVEAYNDYRWLIKAEEETE